MANPCKSASLAPFNTLGFDARCTMLIEATRRDHLLAACQRALQNSLPLLPIGGGSNLILRKNFDGIALRIATQGIRLIDECDSWITLSVEAGENWHAFVAHCIEQGWFGLENLALIPGTVGAAPMQNIGAYGVEVAEFIRAVEVLDRQRGELSLIDAADCGFGYRQSHFKGLWKDRYLILAVHFRLRRQPQLKIDYQGLADQMGDCEPTPQALFDAVVELRRNKLPDPARLANVGSFFKNPVVSEAQAEALRQRYPDLVSYPDAQGVKLAAGWLIDRAGWKGIRRGHVGVHAQQALVLVHYGGGDADELLSLAADIQDSIRVEFGVELEIEPVIYP